MPTFRNTAASFRQGARTLPRERYVSAAVLAAEQDAIFGRLWNCVGRARSIPRPGDFLVAAVAGESLIVVRGDDGVVRALFNVCRHRGTRLCDETGGRFAGAIQCPYHAWTYTTEGSLIGAPHMHDVPGFDRADYSLYPAAVAEYGGFLFVNVARAPQPFSAWMAPLAERLDRFDLESLSAGHRAEYDVGANWKLVFQNYSECLHCPVIHPELAARLPYQSSANDLDDGPFLGGYIEIADACESATATGRWCAAPLNRRPDAEDRRRAYYYSVMPNLLLSVHPDYVNYYLVTPLAADRTRVRSEWLFRPDQREAEFNPGDAVTFWDRVNRQDWQIVERSQLGVASRRYLPGPYSPRESIAAAWDREYLRLMRAAAADA